MGNDMKRKENSFLIIYDDSFPKSDIIKDIIGEKGFADVIVKRKTLFEYYKENFFNVLNNASWIKLNSVYSIEKLNENLLEIYDEKSKVIHCFANYIISDTKRNRKDIDELIQSSQITKGISDGKASIIFFPSLKSYSKYIRETLDSEMLPYESVKQIAFTQEISGFTNISVISNFITCITGNFDSRYFNSLSGDEYVINKSSSNKKKILSEYTFYRLLPDDMKYWFVMPFDYREEGDRAIYSMERMHMTDLAIKWVHGSIDKEEFEFILDKYFYFFNNRHSKRISIDAYKEISDKLYVKKVLERIDRLKKTKEFEGIAKIIEAGTDEKNIDAIVEKYLKVKHKIESNIDFRYISVIGHGDPCFANAMYNKSTRTLKFIDPKGALDETELWTNPYYDIAKLSHSICGRYDFFNNALFEIDIDEKLKCKLEIPFNNSPFIEIFRNKLEENRYDYKCVRIYEASLFLSMLPFHIDNPKKVLGFILNAINIIKELE